MHRPTIGTLALLAALLTAPAWAGEAVPEDVAAGNMDSNAALPPEQSGIAVASGADEESAAMDEPADAVATDEAEAPPVTDESAEAPSPDELPAERIATEPQFLPDGAPPEPVEQPTVPPRE
ncbi:hypothetical protein [Indioceanicola profundi]|uniref:hypothetical protein n=1 Tax=Indioceanicola profundi TaxID=2220096 RepID=UPI000E6AA738|nr:hypothetical protein [Indioceanicola profundi]